MKLNPEDGERLRAAFDAADQNGDGYIDSEELVEILRTTRQQANPVELDAMQDDVMSFCDVDHDGRINLEEFIRTFEQDLGIFDFTLKRLGRRLTVVEVGRLQTGLETLNPQGVSSNQLVNILDDCLSSVPEETRKEIKDMIVRDHMKDGVLNTADFLKTLAQHGVPPKEMSQARARTLASRLTEEEVVQLKRLFTLVDSDSDGFLDEKELGRLLMDSFSAPENILRETREILMSCADRNKDGRLDLSEFIRWFAAEQGVLPKEVAPRRAKWVSTKLTREEVETLKTTFKEIDVNNDGQIDSEELEALLAVQLPSVPPDVLAEIKHSCLASADKDSDGRLNLTEFCRSFALQQGVLPFELAAGTRERMDAFQREQHNERSAMHHEPRMIESAGGVGLASPSSPVAPPPAPSPLTELMASDVSGVLVSDSQLRELFQQYDTNGNEWISIEEFIGIYKMFDLFGEETDATITSRCKSFKGFSDGRLSFQEFAILMLHLAQK